LLAHSIVCRASGEDTAKAHPDVDDELSLKGYVITTSEILHNLDIDCTLGLARGHIRVNLQQRLSDIYSAVGDEIFDDVKIADRRGHAGNCRLTNCKLCAWLSVQPTEALLCSDFFN
jgi:hypothetical protein